MKPIAASAPYWIAGIVLAFSGVAIARLAAPALPASTRLPATVAGELLALTGLLVICLGVRARIRREPPAGAG